MPRTVVATANAPQAIGPYSQAITLDNLVFCSGQIPLTPAGTLAEGDITAQTRQVLTNLQAVLQAAGSSLGNVLKTTVFLADMNEFAAMNAVYAEFFAGEPPARSTVQVSRLPRDVRVEIEAIAVRG
ncbi:MAG: RidA family protein [Chloroflexi bacterium SZAS-1]|jgi:2-iminobutanoate/2-iminopropanoate deaminase|nr:RidA family protein [Chloroflexi bacterium SZAS-1]HNP87441.1 RidA family protein [Kouleothrix sp.]